MLRYFCGGCDNGAFREFLLTSKVQLRACLNHNNAKQPVTVLFRFRFLVFLGGIDEL